MSLHDRFHIMSPERSICAISFPLNLLANLVGEKEIFLSQFESLDAGFGVTLSINSLLNTG